MDSATFERTAHDLHAKLLSEIKATDYDPFEQRNSQFYDSLQHTAVQRVFHDTQLRKKATGPSIKREKFQPSYWSTWNKEKNILEQETKREIEKEERAAIADNVTTRGRRKGESGTTAPGMSNSTITKGGDTSSKLALSGSSRTAGPATRFAGGKFNDDFEPYFDTHLHGQTTVKFLSQIVDNAKRSKRSHSNSKGRRTSTKEESGAEREDEKAALGIKFTKDTRVKKGASVALAPVPDVVDKVNIKKVKGGSMGGANRLSGTSTGGSQLTKNCDFAPLQEAVQANKGCTFPQTQRFPNPVKRLTTTSDTVNHASVGYDLSESKDIKDNRKIPISFPAARRFPKEPKKEAPLPPPPHQQDGRGGNDGDTEASTEVTGMRALAPPARASLTTFGKGCDRHQHVLYGMCTDQHCAERALFEQSTLRANDLRRMGGYERVDRFGKNKGTLQEDIALSRAMTELLPDPVYTITPLYAAAYGGDVPAIKQLAVLKADPNALNSYTGYAALHVAAARCQYTAIVAMLNAFRGQIDLSIRDHRGDTALHIASRKGFTDIVRALCSESECTAYDPTVTRNNKGELPIDIVKSHRVFQEIKSVQDRIELERELEQLQLDQGY